MVDTFHYLQIGQMTLRNNCQEDALPNASLQDVMP